MSIGAETDFADRRAELEFLDGLLERPRPSRGELVLLYGRRRVGKSRLLVHWGERAPMEFTYWAAEKEPALQQPVRTWTATLRVQDGRRGHRRQAHAPMPLRHAWANRPVDEGSLGAACGAGSWFG